MTPEDLNNALEVQQISEPGLFGEIQVALSLVVGLADLATMAC